MRSLVSSSGISDSLSLDGRAPAALHIHDLLSRVHCGIYARIVDHLPHLAATLLSIFGRLHDVPDHVDRVHQEGQRIGLDRRPLLLLGHVVRALPACLLSAHQASISKGSCSGCSCHITWRRSRMSTSWPQRTQV